jgi:protein SCO1
MLKIEPRRFLMPALLLAAAAFAGAAAYRSGQLDGARSAERWGVPEQLALGEQDRVYGTVPEFSLIERSGRRVALADLRGKVWIANFFYSRCTHTCPLQTAHMAMLQEELAGEDDVRLLSISVDPDHDTPAQLADYARRYNAHPERWLFLTGARHEIARLAGEGFRLGVV